MLSVDFIRQNLDAVKQAIRVKKVDLEIDELLIVWQQKNTLLREIEALRATKNRINSEIGGAEKDVVKRKHLLEEGKRVKLIISDLEEQLVVLQKTFDSLLVKVPNVVSQDTPIGNDDSDNVEVYRSGKIPEMDFEPKDHIQLGEELNILDLPRGVKTGGYRSYYIKNEGVSVVLGFLMYAIHKMIIRGYAPLLVPTIVKEHVLFGTGYFKGRNYNPLVDEIYSISSDSRISDTKFLVGTAEPSMLAFYGEEVLMESDLPIRNCGFSQCYRSEIGAHGKDTKGIYRVHEFMKVEQTVIAKADIEESLLLQDEMIFLSREIHADLGLPHRQIQICSGDLGLGKFRMFDTEVWLPGLNRWGETGSSSNFLDWQARRLNVRYRLDSGEKKYVFMLNNTALPSPRIFIAILENFQQKDGSVVVPEAIKPFMPVKYDVIRRK